MPKKIIVAFDGTWNLPDQAPEIDGDASTNVVKLHDAILPTQKDGTVQKKIYVAGVGTDWYDKLEGGAFGVGLSKKSRKATSRWPKTTNRAIRFSFLVSVAGPIPHEAWWG
jgi:uncharacterized protein (DUF2235 family)